MSARGTRPDDEQDRRAIRAAGAAKRMLVAAGPGTGKTEIAALRMADLLRSGLSPGQILVLSFSRSAVRTLTRRLSRIAGSEDSVLEELRHVSIRTFDSWAFRLLRLLGLPASKLLSRGHDENISELTRFIGSSQRDAVRGVIGSRRHLIVDEFQDLPGVRGELVLALLDLLAPPRRPGAGFTILGDPAQAIYGFAVQEEGRTYPTPAEYWERVICTYGSELEQRSLERNFRASEPLAKVSAILRQVLLSERSDSEKLQFVREVVAALPSPREPASRDWLREGSSRSRAVLTRSNGEAVRVLQALLGSEVEGPGMPVRLRAGSYASLPPAWIAGLLRRWQSPGLTRSRFGRIYEHLRRQWDEAVRAHLCLPPEDAAWSRLARASNAPEEAREIRIPDLRARLSWPDAFPDDQLVGEEGLVVTTIHQSKGLEFDIVTLLDTGRDDAEAEEGGNELDDRVASEEANVHYVALTRAGRELNRLDGRTIHGAPRKREFKSGRERLFWWRGKWINMEMGLRGDLDPFGFVDCALHGGAAGTEDLQEFLLRNAGGLEGHKVMLRKHVENGRAVWQVHLQKGTAPDRLIGRTAPQLTHDLLDILHGQGYALPSTIMNLRIAGVGTVSSDAEYSLEEPDRTSRLWLGVSLFGTGDFRTYKRRR